MYLFIQRCFHCQLIQPYLKHQFKPPTTRITHTSHVLSNCVFLTASNITIHAVRHCRASRVFVAVDVSVPAWPLSAVPTLQSVFVKLSVSSYHCDRLSSCPRRLLHLPDTRRTTQRWRSVGNSVGLALVGQAGKETSRIMLQVWHTKSTILKH
jgi:hypothetical protein